MKNIISILLLLFILNGCSNNNSDYSLIPVKPYGKKGYIFIDPKGNTVITPSETLYSATAFHEGFSLVNAFGYTFIDKKGNFLTTERYKDATLFRDGIAWCVEENSYPVAIDKKGKELFSLKDAYEVRAFSEGLAAFQLTGGFYAAEWGFVDKKGNVAIPPTFEYVSDFKEGLAVATIRNESGYINKKGEFVIAPQFTSAMQFNKKGYAIVAIGEHPEEKYGVIDKKGKYVIAPQYKRLFADGDNFLVISPDLGWLNAKGKIIIQPQYTRANCFYDNDYAPVSLDYQKFGVIDKKGTMVVAPQFDLIYPFIGDIAPVKIADKIGFIDTKGNIVVNPQYEDVSNDHHSNKINSSSIYHAVQTDYIDMENVCSFFLDNNSNHEKFKGNSKSTTYADIKNRFGNALKVDSQSSRKITKSEKIGKGIEISNAVFRFPVTLSSSAYNFYTKKTETHEANSANITSATYEIVLSENTIAKDKGILLMNTLSEAIKKNCGMSVQEESNNRVILDSDKLHIKMDGSKQKIKLTVSFK